MDMVISRLVYYCASPIIASVHFHNQKQPLLKSVMQHNSHRTIQQSTPQYCMVTTRGSSRSSRDSNRSNIGITSSNDGNSQQSKQYNLAQNSAELFDIYPAPPSPLHHNSIITPDWGSAYFPHPLPTGEVKERVRVHIDGDWHRSIQVWIIERNRTSSQDNGEGGVTVLLQRRSPYKDTHPNLLDVSCAGHVNAGDDVVDTTMRELHEELGGNGALQQLTLNDLRRSKAFTVTSAIEGETERFGKFICREYQDVFILEWKSGSMDVTSFQPLAQEEVSGFVLMEGKELIERLRNADAALVPRSIEYIDELVNIFFS